MIDFYTWTAPNAQKVSIMLEEVGLPYAVHAIDLGKGDQHDAAFLALNPNGKVPVIVDRDGPGGAALTLVESGAILIYLAEKTGRLFASDGRARAATLQWLMFQMGSIGPTLHDAYYFLALAPERLPVAIDYFTTETNRVLGLLDAQFADHEFVAGNYSIGDIAIYPWIAAAVSGGLPGMERLTNLMRWYTAVGARPAVVRGMAVPVVQSR